MQLGAEHEHEHVEDQAESDDEDEGLDIPGNFNPMNPMFPGQGWGQGQGLPGLGGPPGFGMWNQGMAHQWGEGHRMVDEDELPQPDQPVQQLAGKFKSRDLFNLTTIVCPCQRFATGNTLEDSNP
jgi:hypothetical protein